MEVRGRERVAFNFKGLLKSFASGNDVINDDDIEKELSKILKEENADVISKLEKSTDPTRFVNSKKGGHRRKKGELDVQTVEAKQIKRDKNVVKETGEKERE